MYWCIDKTTSNERTTISNAMYCLFADLERAETLLDTVAEEHFGDRVQKPLDATAAAWVGTLLHVARDIVSDTIVAYYLTVADTENVRAKNYIAAAEAVKTAMQCEQARESVYTQVKKLPVERCQPITEAREKIGDMEDAAAILAFNGLVKNGGKISDSCVCEVNRN